MKWALAVPKKWAYTVLIEPDRDVLTIHDGAIKDLSAK